jgi:hypothetical protein
MSQKSSGWPGIYCLYQRIRRSCHYEVAFAWTTDAFNLRMLTIMQLLITFLTMALPPSNYVGQFHAQLACIAILESG